MLPFQNVEVKKKEQTPWMNRFKCRASPKNPKVSEIHEQHT
jgi:hypothetical protein